MPTGWIEPALFLQHKKVRVYNTYKDDDVGNGARDYWFTVSTSCGEGSCQLGSGCECKNVFDVRDLGTWTPYEDGLPSGTVGRKFTTPPPVHGFAEHVRGTIKQAIDQGLLKAEMEEEEGET